jgi:DNA-directed RNA polymerase specialized sigma24 family protein
MESFDQLYLEYQQYVRAIIARRVPAADADDLAQQTWLVVHERIQAGYEPTNIRAWRASEARTACSSYSRARRQHPMVSLDSPVGNDDDGEPLTVADTLTADGGPVDIPRPSEIRSAPL